MSLLPPELWALVFEAGLDRFDLSTVCKTSKAAADLARPILYRSVNLRSHKGGCCGRSRRINGAAQSTMRLLVEDPGLARNVTSMKLHTTALCTGTIPEDPWIDFEVFGALPNLNSLTFDGLSLGSDKNRRMFLDSVPVLKSLKIEGHHLDLGDNFAIAGLQRIYWTATLEPCLKACFSLVQASCDTITHLQLPSLWSLDEDEEDLVPSHEFPDLRLPKLINLNVDYQDAANSPDVAPKAITRFLAAHPLIEDLTLMWADEDDDSECGSVTLLHGEEIPGPAFLPNLRRFTGDTRNLSMMASKQVESLGNLTSIYTGIWLEKWREEDVEDIYEELQRFKGFPSLKELEFEVFDPRRINWWAALCPAVQRFVCAAEVDIKPQGLGGKINFQDFAAFPALVELEFWSEPSPGMINTVFALVATLKGIVLLKALPQVGRSRFEVLRNVDGTVSSVVSRSFFREIST